VSLFELARFMGTSVEQIDKTYGHLLPDALERTRQALDSFVATAPVAEPVADPEPQKSETDREAETFAQERAAFRVSGIPLGKLAPGRE
jgi:hypothetical protein